MNIFFLDTDPVKAAKYHCDKHVVKMIVETAQLLCTAHHALGTTIDKDQLYKPTHINHPSAIWVRESNYNYSWTYNLFRALMDEYTDRYGKTHACNRLKYVLNCLPVAIPMLNKFTKVKLAMPTQYMGASAVNSYRRYYQAEKAKFATWKNSQPDWWVDKKELVVV